VGWILRGWVETKVGKQLLVCWMGQGVFCLLGLWAGDYVVSRRLYVSCLVPQGGYSAEGGVLSSVVEGRLRSNLYRDGTDTPWRGGAVEGPALIRTAYHLVVTSGFFAFFSTSATGRGQCGVLKELPFGDIP
jgi:hypothetical protein